MFNMLDFSFEIPEGALLNIKNGFPNIKKAVVDGGYLIRNNWIRTADQALNRATGEYIRGIQKDPRSTYGGWGSEITNVASHAAVVEDGHSGFSLPQAIDWNSAPKVRQGKNGPYLIIPFRHFTPMKSENEGRTYRGRKQSMPQEIYRFVMGMSRSKDMPKSQGGMINPRTGRYNANTLWGGRIVQKNGSLAIREFSSPKNFRDRHIGEYGERQFVGGKDGIFESQREHWKYPKYAGMVRTGAKRHTRYMTFRIITPRSDGWNIPPKNGLHIGERVLRASAQDLEKLIIEAAMKDLGV